MSDEQNKIQPTGKLYSNKYRSEIVSQSYTINKKEYLVFDDAVEACNSFLEKSEKKKKEIKNNDIGYLLSLGSAVVTLMVGLMKGYHEGATIGSTLAVLTLGFFLTHSREKKLKNELNKIEINMGKACILLDEEMKKNFNQVYDFCLFIEHTDATKTIIESF